MKTRNTSTWGLLAGALLLSGSVITPDLQAQEAEVDLDQFYADIESPGEDHKRLNQMVGEWNTSVTLYSGIPDEEPEMVTGSMSYHWILDGRFVRSSTKSPNEDGSVFESMGIIGYNQLTGMYEKVWMNNGSTTMYTDAGRYFPEEKVLRLQGFDTDPETGFKLMMTTEYKFDSKDKFTQTMYATGADGIPSKQLEIVHTRK